jgi:hypothetical protein
MPIVFRIEERADEACIKHVSPRSTMRRDASGVKTCTAQL